MRFILYLTHPEHDKTHDILYRGVAFLDSPRQVYNLGNGGGVPVHHDPVDGIVANHEK